jgi:hypothetical protein
MMRNTFLRAVSWHGDKLCPETRCRRTVAAIEVAPGWVVHRALSPHHPGVYRSSYSVSHARTGTVVKWWLTKRKAVGLAAELSALFPTAAAWVTVAEAVQDPVYALMAKHLGLARKTLDEVRAEMG